MRSSLFFVLALAFPAVGCGPSGTASTSGRAPLADKWLSRAKASYRAGDFDDAEQAAQSGLVVAPRDPDLRTLKAKVALGRLEYTEVGKLTEGIDTAEAHSVRGRAFWYAGKLEEAADELDIYLRDPAVKDSWARDVAKLARTGTGRKPFDVDGPSVALVEMPRAGHASVVPCELDGERILALVATASAELVVDAASRKDPSWVSLRFAERFEVRDVPALTQDLSPLSQKMGAPVKALIGMEVLRKLRATIDRRGDQFVVRKQDSPTPPEASRTPLWYLRGGALALKASLAGKDGATSLLVDSSQPFLVALSDASWKRAGVSEKSFSTDPALPAPMKTANVPFLKIGSFDFSGAPAIQGFSLESISSDIDLGGVLGAALVSSFRMTFVEEGRYAWLEPDPIIFAPRGKTAEPPPAPSLELPPLAPLGVGGAESKKVVPPTPKESKGKRGKP